MKHDFGNLMSEAIRARENAYVPYSNFRVGAALLALNGKVYHGCNIENASYSPTNCAERTAFFKAVSEGERDFEAIAIIGGENKEGDYCSPCGVCRQVMLEFCNPDFLVVLGNSPQDYKVYTLDELIPHSFKRGDLNK